MPLTLRNTKGSALTFTELDDNFSYTQLPVGVVLPYAGTSAPTNFLFCYGQAVSRSTYASLFTALSTTYGAGDGSTTFNLPDLRGRVVAGKDDMGGSSANRLTGTSGSLNGDNLAATGGAETVTLTTTEMPVHSHSVSDPSHTHGVSHDAIGSSGAVAIPGGSAAPYTAANINIQGAFTGISIQNAGSGGAHNNVQPTIILNYIIRAL